MDENYYFAAETADSLRQAASQMQEDVNNLRAFADAIGQEVKAGREFNGIFAQNVIEAVTRAQSNSGYIAALRFAMTSAARVH